MAREFVKRKLAAILSEDVEGYSRLMGDDEEATVRTITSYRTAIADFVQQFRGRVVDTPGDNILTEFTSVVDAVNCAVEIQRDLAERNTELPYDVRCSSASVSTSVMSSKRMAEFTAMVST